MIVGGVGIALYALFINALMIIPIGYRLRCSNKKRPEGRFLLGDRMISSIG